VKSQGEIDSKSESKIFGKKNYGNLISVIFATSSAM
jgi:hypothetical protein